MATSASGLGANALLVTCSSKLMFCVIRLQAAQVVTGTTDKDTAGRGGVMTTTGNKKQ